MNEAYFENVIGIGDLFLDKVFNVFEGENIVFVCKDSEDKKYLCICYEIRYYLKWILCPISNISLLNLIYKDIDLKTIFLCKNEITEIIFDGKNETSKIWNIQDFDSKLLPNENTFLEADEDLSGYILTLGATTITSYTEFLIVDYNELISDKTNEILDANSKTFSFQFQADISIENIERYRAINIDDSNLLAA